MISSSDKQRYSNTVVEFPQPLRENPCTNGHFHSIFLMRVRTGARPRALATLACSFPLPDSLPHPPPFGSLASLASPLLRARARFRSHCALRMNPQASLGIGGKPPNPRVARGERLGPYLSALPPCKGYAPAWGLRYPDAPSVRPDMRRLAAPLVLLLLQLTTSLRCG